MRKKRACFERRCFFFCVSRSCFREAAGDYQKQMLKRGRDGENCGKIATLFYIYFTMVIFTLHMHMINCSRKLKTQKGDLR
jgi:hypothetical protein